MSTEPPQILFDAQIDQVPLELILQAVRSHLVADARNKAVSPPRHQSIFPTGSLVFTVGGNAQMAGFRTYETFKSTDRAGEDEITAVWDQRTCRLKGIALGRRLGAIRTGALGGVAVDVMAPPNASVCGVIGSGLQAETQLLAIATVRRLREIRVFSRNPGTRAAFADRVGTRTGLNIRPTETARQCAEGADIIVLATDSSTPVIDESWVLPKAHVSTVGPKFRDDHELPLELALRATVIASDSPQQIVAQGAQHMLHGMPAADRIQHLGRLALSFDWNVSTAPTLYLSAGLAGSEVAVLDAALTYFAR